MNLISKVVPARYQQPITRQMMPTMQPNVGIQPQEMISENAATITQMNVPESIPPRQNFLPRNSGTSIQAFSSKIGQSTNFIAAYFLNCVVNIFSEQKFTRTYGCDSQWLKIKLLCTIWRTFKLSSTTNVKLIVTCANCMFLIINWTLI